MWVCIGVCVRAGRHVGTCKSNAQNCSCYGCWASFMLFFFQSWEVALSSSFSIFFSTTFLLTQLVNCIVVCVCLWVCVRICLVIKCAQQQSIGLYLLAISMPALVLVAKQRCFCSYSLFSSSFMLAVCPAAALTAKAATTAIDNKRRRRWLCHRLSLSLSPSTYATFHVSFYEWRQRRRSRRKQTTKKHKTHFYICKIYKSEKANVGWEEWNKIK